MTYTDDIKRLRKEAKMTQKEMGESVGLCQTSYARIESGRISPKVSMLNNIAKVLGKKMLILFIDEEKVQE